jgi:hypothetical protein
MDTSGNGEGERRRCRGTEHGKSILYLCFENRTMKPVEMFLEDGGQKLKID